MRWRHTSNNSDLIRVNFNASFRNYESKKFTRGDAKYTLPRIQSDIMLKEISKEHPNVVHESLNLITNHPHSLR